MKNQSIDLLVEAVTEYWGKRCEPRDPDCPCCRAWDQLDRLAHFYGEVARVTTNHASIHGAYRDGAVFVDDQYDEGPVAAVTASTLSQLLQIVDKEWWKHDSLE